MREEFRHGFLFVGNRADHYVRAQGKNLIDTIHVPAVTELRQMVNRRHLGAPLRHAHERTFGANGAQDGRSTRGERDDPQVGGIAQVHTRSLAQAAESRAGNCRLEKNCLEAGPGLFLSERVD